MKTIVASTLALIAVTLAGSAFAGQDYGHGLRDVARLGLITPGGVFDGR